jgi:hypothetical protein
MKTITVTTDDATALALLGLLVDKKVVSVHMEDTEGEKTRQPKHRRHNTNQTLQSTIADAFPVGKTFSSVDAEKAIETAGYKPNGASGTISRLIQCGFVRRSDDGDMVFVKKMPAGFAFPSHMRRS